MSKGNLKKRKGKAGEEGAQASEGTSAAPATQPDQQATAGPAATSAEGPDVAQVEPDSTAPAAQERSSGLGIRSVLSWVSGHPEITAAVVTTILCVYFLRKTIRPAGAVRSFNAHQLSFYKGRNAPLYLAILGEVFDVTKGKNHYGEKGYGFFVGKDASRAFVTGDFSKDLTDDIGDFTPEQFKALVEWRDFYRKTYPYKGYMVGRLYRPDGSPTRLLQYAEKEATKAKSDEERQAEWDRQWPSCNVRWTEAEGTTVWCDGGAFPRKLVMEQPNGATSSRCACFKEVGWSDLRQVYPGCKPDATTCKLPEAGSEAVGSGRAARSTASSEQGLKRVRHETGR